MQNQKLKKNIKFIAQKLGFHDCRIASALPAPHAGNFKKWLASGHQADMHWLEQNVAKRCDIRKLFPPAKSVIVLALSYHTRGINMKTREAFIASYARGNDYHKVIKQKLRELYDYLEQFGGEHKICVDTSPTLERDYASLAGLGWNGKSAMQIHRKLGARFFISLIATSLELPPDRSLGNGCADCRLCVDACPTQAIIAEHIIDARKCLAFWNIENRGKIPKKYAVAMDNRIFGCDDCQDACPYNDNIDPNLKLEEEFKARNYTRLKLLDFLKLDVEEFRRQFTGSAIKRAKRQGLLRNVLIAIANRKNIADLPQVEEFIKREKDNFLKQEAKKCACELQQTKVETGIDS